MRAVRRLQFYAAAMGEEIGVHDYQNVLNLDYYLNVFRPDVVVFEVAEYALTDTYFDSELMAEADFNPALVDVATDVPVGEQVARWLETATELPVPEDVAVTRGHRVDVARVGHTFSDARYAWLVDGDVVLDLRRGDEGLLAASTEAGLVREGDEVLVLVEERDGLRVWSRMRVRDVVSVLGEATCSDGATEDGEGYVFATLVEGNAFDAVEVQLLDTEGGYLATIDSSVAIGKTGFSYPHELESGDYLVRLKVNSNLADESATFPAYLERGKTYMGSYVVDMLKERYAHVSSFDLAG